MTGGIHTLARHFFPTPQLVRLSDNRLFANLDLLDFFIEAIFLAFAALANFIALTTLKPLLGPVTSWISLGFLAGVDSSVLVGLMQFLAIVGDLTLGEQVSPLFLLVIAPPVVIPKDLNSLLILFVLESSLLKSELLRMPDCLKLGVLGLTEGKSVFLGLVLPLVDITRLTELDFSFIGVVSLLVILGLPLSLVELGLLELKEPFLPEGDLLGLKELDFLYLGLSLPKDLLGVTEVISGLAISSFKLPSLGLTDVDFLLSVPKPSLCVLSALGVMVVESLLALLFLEVGSLSIILGKSPPLHSTDLTGLMEDGALLIRAVLSLTTSLLPRQTGLVSLVDFSSLRLPFSIPSFLEMRVVVSLSEFCSRLFSVLLTCK